VGNEEYLILAKTSAFENYSELATVDNNGAPASLRTSFTHLRIDPQTLQVNVADFKFAMTLGGASVGGIAFNTMIAGAAMACHPFASASANLDLRGTPFSVASTWKVEGQGAVSSHEIGHAGQTVTLQASGGDCVWVSLAGGPDDPRDVPDSAWSLQLAYTK
jgi:hypothetical protein